MKYAINIIASFLSLAIIACNQTDTARHQHAAGEMKEQADTNSASAGQGNPDAAVPGAVTIKDDRLNAVYQQYTRLTEALVKGDMTNAKIAGNAIRAGLKETAQAGAKETAAIASLEASAEKIAQAQDIASQRKAYAGMSDGLIALVKKAGVANGTLYVSYCPMVFDDKGASWLSRDKKILNPYFGDKMLTCGEIKETIYNKIENGTRDITIEELDKIARYFAMSIDQVVHFDDAAPAEVTIEDKAGFEQINQLDEEDKSTVFKIIDTMLTKKKFKDFF